MSNLDFLDDEDSEDSSKASSTKVLEEVEDGEKKGEGKGNVKKKRKKNVKGKKHVEPPTEVQMEQSEIIENVSEQEGDGENKEKKKGSEKKKVKKKEKGKKKQNEPASEVQMKQSETIEEASELESDGEKKVKRKESLKKKGKKKEKGNKQDELASEVQMEQSETIEEASELEGDGEKKVMKKRSEKKRGKKKEKGNKQDEPTSEVQMDQLETIKEAPEQKGDGEKKIMRKGNVKKTAKKKGKKKVKHTSEDEMDDLESMESEMELLESMEESDISDSEWSETEFNKVIKKQKKGKGKKGRKVKKKKPAETEAKDTKGHVKYADNVGNAEDSELSDESEDKASTTDESPLDIPLDEVPIIIEPVIKKKLKVKGKKDKTDKASTTDEGPLDIPLDEVPIIIEPVIKKKLKVKGKKDKTDKKRKKGKKKEPGLDPDELQKLLEINEMRQRQEEMIQRETVGKMEDYDEVISAYEESMISRSDSTIEEETEEDEKKEVDESDLYLFSRRSSKRRSKRRTRKITLKQTTKKPERSLNYEGLEWIKLTWGAQERLGCIAETPEVPWMRVPKPLFLEEIKKSGEHSPLHKFLEKIEAYPEESLLIGLDLESPDEDGYFLCLWHETEPRIQHLIDKHEKALQEKTYNAINRQAKDWTTLGSENEVDWLQIRQKRPYLEQDAIVPVCLDDVSFTNIDPEDQRYGSVSFTTRPRLKPKNIRRRCLDKEVQAVVSYSVHEAQTFTVLQVNKWTQYEYTVDLSQPLEDTPDIQRAAKFLESCLPEIERELKYIDDFDPFYDDFEKLVLDPKDAILPEELNYRDYESFIDIITCRGKIISAVSWHPTWTGVAACAYVSDTRRLFERNRIVHDNDAEKVEVKYSTYGSNFVLIWCFSDRFRPKFFLSCPREVHSLSFCPYDENVLVGGLINGQIVIWDLTDRLTKVEFEEPLTEAQSYYRNAMMSHLRWIKLDLDKSRVAPVAISSVQASHKSCIVDLKWLTPTCPLTSLSRFDLQSDDTIDPKKYPLQFLSCSEDGSVCVWDLRSTQALKFGGGLPRKKRKVRRRPEQQDDYVSEFKKLHKIFHPIYRILIQLPFRTDTVKGIIDSEPENTPLDIPLSNFTYFNPPIKYIPIAHENVIQDDDDMNYTKYRVVTPPFNSDVDSEENPQSDNETVSEPILSERRMYTAKPLLLEDTPRKLFSLGTIDGCLITISWQGLDANINTIDINYESAEIHSITTVHDGPITALSRSKFIPELILSVGGRIFAIWKEARDKQPIFWRRSSVSLSSGMWSEFRPTSFYIVHFDGMIELWDLLEQTNKPIFTQNISGKKVTGVYQHTLPMEENIIGFADFKGTFRVCTMPEDHCEPNDGNFEEDIEDMTSIINREIVRRRKLRRWQEDWNKRHSVVAVAPQEDEDEDSEIRKREQMEAERLRQLKVKNEEMDHEFEQLIITTTKPYLYKIQTQKKWHQREEKRMLRGMLGKKGLNKEQLKREQQPLLIAQAEEEEKRKRQLNLLRKNNRIFRKLVSALFPEMIIGPTMPLEYDNFIKTLDELKPFLLKHYKDVESDVLEFIEKNASTLEFDWKTLLTTGIENRLIVDMKHPPELKIPLSFSPQLLDEPLTKTIEMDNGEEEEVEEEEVSLVEIDIPGISKGFDEEEKLDAGKLAELEELGEIGDLNILENLDVFTEDEQQSIIARLAAIEERRRKQEEELKYLIEQEEEEETRRLEEERRKDEENRGQNLRAELLGRERAGEREGEVEHISQKPYQENDEMKEDTEGSELTKKTDVTGKTQRDKEVNEKV